MNRLEARVMETIIDALTADRQGLSVSFADQLSAVAESLEELMQARADLIRKRREQGATLRQIGSEAHLSAVGVKNILDKAPGVVPGPPT